MNDIQHRMCGGILAGTLVMVIGLLGAVPAAQAAVPCVVGPGVTQTDTTVTGSPGNDTIDCGGASPGKTINGNAGNDTIIGTASDDTIDSGDANDTITGGAGNDTLNGGLGIDTISGSDGNDNLAGPSNDGSQDSLDGGLGTDTCQGPAPDPDIHASCESTSSPSAGSGATLASELCGTTGGLFVNVPPLIYNCVFLLSQTPVSNQRRPEAQKICTGRGGAFVNLPPLDYSCALPG
jgi:hypothetical protein